MDTGIVLGVPAAVAEIEAAIFLPRWMMLGLKAKTGLEEREYMGFRKLDVVILLTVI